MTTTINASPTNGIVQTADGSGVMKLQSNGVTTNALAWVNFNGTSGSTSIRASLNVSSITTNAQGDWTVNFTNSFSDANYVPVGMTSNSLSANYFMKVYSSSSTAAPTTQSTSACRIGMGGASGSGGTDFAYVYVAFFGN